MTLPIFVINLDRSPDRLAAMSDKLSSIGLSFVRVSAIDGRTMSTEALADFVARRPDYGWHPGAIGCLLSHQRAWQAFEGGEFPYALFLEDDVHISDDLPDLIRMLTVVLASIDILRLETTTNRVLLAKTPRFTVGSFELAPLRSAAWGAGAYILSKGSAARLLSVPESDQSPADFLLFHPHRSPIPSELKIFQCTPAPCVQDKYDHDVKRLPLSYVSLIEHDSDLSPLSRLILKLQSKIVGGIAILRGFRRVPCSTNLRRR